MGFDPADYPEDWKNISNLIRFERARARCECTGECGLHGPSLFKSGIRRCVEVHGKKAKWAKGDIMLTVAHLNAKDGPCQCSPLCSNPDHLKAMCQRCHLRYDGDRHADSAARKRDQMRLRNSILEEGKK